LAHVRVRRGILVAVTASSLGHALAFFLLDRPRASRPHLAPEDWRPIDLDIVSTLTTPAVDSIPSLVPDSPPPPRVERRRAPQRTPEPRPEVFVHPEASATAPEIVSVPDRKVAVIDLSPLAASRTIFDVHAAPAAVESRRPSAPEADPEARLNTYLAQVAESKPWLSRTKDPVLTRNEDGSLSHDGNGFDAVIEADGRVRFEDKYVDFELTFKPKVAEDGSVTFTIFKLTFALDTWIDKQIGKGDPFRAERRWFLERTAQLREERMQKHWQKVAKAGVTSLRHKLQDVWNNAALSLEKRKVATFRYWDDCADDEIGVLGRQVVVDFVRERCPEASACAFVEADLRALNATRRSKAAFAPYAPTSVTERTQTP